MARFIPKGVADDFWKPLLPHRARAFLESNRKTLRRFAEFFKRANFLMQIPTRSRAIFLISFFDIELRLLPRHGQLPARHRVDVRRKRLGFPGRRYLEPATRLAAYPSCTPSKNYAAIPASSLSQASAWVTGPY